MKGTFITAQKERVSKLYTVYMKQISKVPFKMDFRASGRRLVGKNSLEFEYARSRFRKTCPLHSKKKRLHLKFLQFSLPYLWASWKPSGPPRTYFLNHIRLPIFYPSYPNRTTALKSNFRIFDFDHSKTFWPLEDGERYRKETPKALSKG